MESLYHAEKSENAARLRRHKQEQDNEPNANVVQSDNEQEQIVDSNSSPEYSDDSSETNDDEVQCNYIALGCVSVVCVV